MPKGLINSNISKDDIDGIINKALQKVLIEEKRRERRKQHAKAKKHKKNHKNSK